MEMSMVYQSVLTMCLMPFLIYYSKWKLMWLNITANKNETDVKLSTYRIIQLYW